MPTIAGNNITKKAHDAIVTEALAYAEDMGYCDEVEGFLDHLGFVVEDQTKTVTITATVSGKRLSEDALLADWRWNLYHDDDDVAVSDFSVSVK